MSDQTLSTAPRWYASFPGRVLIASAVSAALIYAALGRRGLALVGHLAATSSWRPHAPRLDLIADSPLAVKIHLATIFGAFLLGAVQMVGPKGRTMHRVLGWTLVTLFMTTAVTALFIRGPGGGFSPLYLFSVWTLIAMPLGVYFARRHKVAGHARMMSGFYYGALIVAGVLAFIPGRLMWRVLFG